MSMPDLQVLDGKLNNVYLNYASTQPVILTNAQSLTLAKSGKGSVFIGALLFHLQSEARLPALGTFCSADMAVADGISLRTSGSELVLHGSAHRIAPLTLSFGCDAGNVTNTAQIALTGSGAVSANRTNNLNLIQQGGHCTFDCITSAFLKPVFLSA
jgi:hypothetical protein